MLKQDGPKEWIFEEYKDILSMNFRFKDKESPRSYVSNMVHNLHVSQNFHMTSLMQVGRFIVSLSSGDSICGMCMNASGHDCHVITAII